MKERAPQFSSLEEALSRRLIRMGMRGAPVLERFNREFAPNIDDSFIIDARRELQSPTLEKGLHVEVGHGYSPYWARRTFSAESPYLGIDGGTSDEGKGWLDYTHSHETFQKAHGYINRDLSSREDKDFIHFIAGDAKAMPLEDDSTREVYMKNVLLAPGVTIRDTHEMMKEFYRVLEPGGLLIVVDDERTPQRTENYIQKKPDEAVGYMTLGITIQLAGFKEVALDEDMGVVYARKSVENDEPPEDPVRVKRKLGARLFKR